MAIFQLTLFMLTILDHLDADDNYDYIVVGSATGGVVASRLAEQKNKVLLIEAGPDDLTYSCQYDNDTCIASPFGNLIAGTPMIPFKKGWWLFGVNDFEWENTVSMPSSWNYNKTLVNYTNNLFSAKMLGGCLSHNGQVWTRGSARDFDYIAQKYNLSDWSFQKVLPFYKKLETYFGSNVTGRGDNGPIHIRSTTPHDWQYTLRAFFNASLESGLEFNNHQNGEYPQSGIGFEEHNIGKYENGSFGLFNTTYYRSASAQSYIREIGIKSGYLTVWYNTTVQRILFDNNNSKNANGVEYYNPNNSDLNAIYCTKEVILSAGTYQSPQILMLSGIGPMDELLKFNITPIHVNNNIGRYGQNHVYFNYNTLVNMSYFGNMTHVRDNTHTIWNTLYNETEYFDITGGISVYLSSGKYNRFGYDYNDIRLEVLGTRGIESNLLVISIDPAIHSRNITIKLKSLDARIYPDVHQYVFSDSSDYDQMMEGILAVRNILYGSDGTDTKIFSDEYNNISSIEEWRDLIWKHHRPVRHVVGTVSMGLESSYPVDTKCSLKGVNNLRIIDVSIWPESTNSGTQSLAYMLGEKCAQHIIDDHKHDNGNWWDENQRYIIIAIAMAIVICLILIIFIGYKYCFKQNKHKKKHNEIIPLIGKK